MKEFPFASLEYATVDTHRYMRNGFPEVVLGQWKTIEQCLGIARKIVEHGQPLLVTRLQPEKGERLQKEFPKGEWHPQARLFRMASGKKSVRRGTVCVVCAGTSDLPVAEEAALTAEMMNVKVHRVTDVGVAGIHRLLAKRDVLKKADAVVAVAEMEGALASVVGGLVSVPVVAVPTSIGYGASFEGVAALLGMLNSCSSNVAVMNIDNGFGAGHYAGLIARAAR